MIISSLTGYGQLSGHYQWGCRTIRFQQQGIHLKCGRLFFSIVQKEFFSRQKNAGSPLPVTFSPDGNKSL